MIRQGGEGIPQRLELTIISSNDIPSQVLSTNSHQRHTEAPDSTHFTGPRVSRAALVSDVSGVDARTQTSPDASWMAVERPPSGKSPRRANGLNS